MSKTKNFIKDLKELVKEDENKLINGKRLGTLKPTNGIPATTGKGRQASETSLGGTGGIASPLIEQLNSGASTRTYHTSEKVKYTTDGIFAFIVNDIASINFKDANNNPAQLQFKDV